MSSLPQGKKMTICIKFISTDKCNLSCLYLQQLWLLKYHRKLKKTFSLFEKKIVPSVSSQYLKHMVYGNKGSIGQYLSDLCLISWKADETTQNNKIESIDSDSYYI